MKQNYQAPSIAIELFTAEEILTDLITVSQSQAGGSDNWEDFIA